MTSRNEWDEIIDKILPWLDQTMVSNNMIKISDIR